MLDHSARVLIVAGAMALSLTLLTSVACSADATAKDFEARQEKDADGNVLNYRLFKPAGYDAGKKYPVILFLHGAGERGSNNTAQVRDALHFTTEAVQKEHPCFVIAPQCPGGRLAFQVYGTSKEYEQTYNDYAKSAGEWKSYKIELAKLPGGAKTRLMVINAPAGKPAAGAIAPPNAAPAQGEFRNISVHAKGQAGAPLDLRKLAFDKKEGKGKLAVSEDGTTITLTADMRAKAAFDFTVASDSVLEFEFRSTSQGNSHAIALDVDDQFDFRWSQVDWGARAGSLPKSPSIPLRLALSAMDKLGKEFSVDDSRLYITGLSMGGYGTWDVIARYPRLFAAAVPVCGGADESTAPAVKDIPIWCFHGGADKTVPTERSRNMIDALKKAGGSPKYTEYPGVGHNSWDKAYSEPEMIKWLFEQKR